MTVSTIAIAASGDDASIDATSGPNYAALTGGVYAPTYNLMRMEKAFVSPNYTNAVSVLRFNTSAIPDGATILSARLRIYIGTDEGSPANGNNRNLNGDWMAAWNGNNADWALTINGTALSVPIGDLVTGQVNALTLIDPATNISKTGNTQIRLGISGGAPTFVNKVMSRSWDHATDPEPVLEVTYDTASPTIGPNLSNAAFTLRHAGLGPYLSTAGAAAGAVYSFGRGPTSTTQGQVLPLSTTAASPDPMDPSNWGAGTLKTMSSAAGTLIEAMATFRVGNIIHIATQIATGAVYYNYFDISTNAWGLATSETVQSGAATTFAPSIGSTFVSLVVRSNGEVLFAYAGGVTVMSGTLGTCYYRRRTGVNTYAAAVRFDNAGSINWLTPVAVLGASDRVHFFLQDGTNSDAYQRTLTAANALQTFPAAYDAGVSSAPNLTKAISYADGATTRVRAPYAAITTGFMRLAKMDSSDAPTVTTEEITQVNPRTNNQRVFALVNDDTTLHHLYADNSTSDLWHDTSANNGGAWAADVEEWDGATINYITANVYTRAGTKYLAMVVDDGGILKYAEIPLSAPPAAQRIHLVGMAGIRGAA